MNISKENIDELNAVLTLELSKDDYEDRVSNVLKDYRKKANIPGFRPGKVPFGMINKMYRKPVLVDEINKMVSESVSKYLIEEKLNILGEPLPHEGEKKEIDWDNDTNFEFKFDLGIAPEFELKLSGRDKIPYYKIKVDDNLLDKYIESYSQRFGTYFSVDTVEENDMLITSIEQLDENGNIKEGGIKNEEARLSVNVIKEDEIKDIVIKAKKGDVLNFDLKKAYPLDTEIAALLKIKKEEVASVSGNFQITIKDIQRFKNAEINQELFDKIYGEGNVKSEVEFRTKLKEEAAVNLVNDSEYKFKLDVKNYFIKKFKKDIPNEFLKRWLFAINEGKFTKEEIDKEFDKFAEDLKWQLVKDKISADNEISVNDDDMKEAAKAMARVQFSQYGMHSVPDEHLETFAQRILEDKEQVRNLHQNKMENKVIEHIKTIAKVDEKEITADKFNKMISDSK